MDVCQWPWCTNEAFVSSGNFGNRLVCVEHFKITNGENWTKDKAQWVEYLIKDMGEKNA